ncbi:MAG: RecQ family ATP-dependent DNA helicase [Spirochaetales bacterium]|nr:RecQ family ATP-dependent DNA helicase [Spirochaetales bacterium]MCF7938397.1 RecQ family ATP-dependent DNA helicase [Spirochaetales bacterium]
MNRNLSESTDPLDQLAQRYLKIPYLFPFQKLVIHNILKASRMYGPDPGGGDTEEALSRQIVILPTGAGKSICFHLPAHLLAGPTLVVYPLLGLMNDQLRRFGDEAVVLRGGQSRHEREEIFRKVKRGKVRMVISNPEALLSPRLLPRLKDLGARHFVIDEAHCISEWGKSFRPAYLELARVAEAAGIELITAFTATASPRVLQEIRERLFAGWTPNLVYANPDRPNIRYQVLPVLSKDRCLTRLFLPAFRTTETGKTSPHSRDGGAEIERPAIIFCRSRASAELTAIRLRIQLPPAVPGLEAGDIRFYHAGLSKEEKNRIERWFFESEGGILASTTAYGMGVDKANIRTVIHKSVPPTVEAYLQESGRGGRDGRPARALLLWNGNDIDASSTTSGEASEHYRQMLGYLVTTGCRRKYLLDLLGYSIDTCGGCDICNGIVQYSPPAAPLITEAIRLNRRKWNRTEALKVLKGYPENTALSGRSLLGRPAGFGILSSWEQEEVGDALRMLLRLGYLKEHRWFPRRGVLSPKDNGSSNQNLQELSGKPETR